MANPIDFSLRPFVSWFSFGLWVVGPHYTRGMNKASLNDKFSMIQEHWQPKVVAQLNGQEVKLVKFQGTFPWHHHEQEDEMLLVWRGQMTIEFRNGCVSLQPGEFCVVPRGVEHRTLSETEAEVLVFEPAQTRNTGNITDERFTAPNGVVI
jgi:mannose-6-phosphate isomerase-like protein (cupin superfamily)